MAYTTEQLAIVCPLCSASAGGKCLEKTMWGQKYIETPHDERVEAAAKGK
jgi:hypothetical protein